MLNEVESYWSRRAESYSEVVCGELDHINEINWMNVILSQIPEEKNIKIADMGTGPGFFAIGLAKRGYAVTAVDYTQEMLNHAMQNAGEHVSKIEWMRGDVQNLEKMQDASMDVIVTRNLTWNLEEPKRAYEEWYRVLKKGGILLNFDAGWYNYLFDDSLQDAYEEDRKNVKDAEVFDFNEYDEAYKMEEIARKLELSSCERPAEDMRMIREAGVDMYMHSAMIGCEMEGKRIETVIIENKNGLETLASKVFIDCTGDGDLAHMADVPMQPNPDGELQPSSYCFILSGVDTESELLNRCMYHNGINGPSQCKPVREKLLAMKAAGADLPDFGGPWFNNVMHKGSVAVNITRRAADATDNRNFSAAECQLREDIFTFTRILKENFAEFADCYVSSTAPQAGVRESRRICGVHTVTADEYVNAYRYEDSISRGIHPIDIHASKGTHQTRIDLDKPAYVPYRALIAPNYPNLLVAGRCLSADRQALASLRVMASCMGTGQAAGVAAAQSVASRRPVQEIDTARLVSTLKDLGTVL